VSLFVGQVSPSRIQGFTSNECVKERHFLSMAKIGPIIRHISARGRQKRVGAPTENLPPVPFPAHVMLRLNNASTLQVYLITDGVFC